MELLKVNEGLIVYEVSGGAWVSRGWLQGPSFTSVQSMLDSTATELGPVGGMIEAGGYTFRIPDQGLTTNRLTTAGGFKININRIFGVYSTSQFGIIDHNTLDQSCLLYTSDAADDTR